MNSEQIEKLIETQKRKIIKRTRQIRCTDTQSRALRIGVGT